MKIKKLIHVFREIYFFTSVRKKYKSAGSLVVFESQARLKKMRSLLILLLSGSSGTIPLGTMCWSKYDIELSQVPTGTKYYLSGQ